MYRVVVGEIMNGVVSEGLAMEYCSVKKGQRVIEEVIAGEELETEQKAEQVAKLKDVRGDVGGAFGSLIRNAGAVQAAQKWNFSIIYITLNEHRKELSEHVRARYLSSPPTRSPPLTTLLTPAGGQYGRPLSPFEKYFKPSLERNAFSSLL